MQAVEINELMESWFLHFDENMMQFKMKHINDFELRELKQTEKTGEDGNEKIKQEEGAGKS